MSFTVANSGVDKALERLPKHLWERVMNTMTNSGRVQVVQTVILSDGLGDYVSLAEKGRIMRQDLNLVKATIKD